MELIIPLVLRLLKKMLIWGHVWTKIKVEAPTAYPLNSHL